MANLNKVMLMGNLTKDPEMRHTPKGLAVTDLAMAVNRTWKDEQGQKQEEVTFLDVTFYGRTAELAQQYLTKGRPVYIEARLRLDTWDDKDTGKKRSKLKLIGENMQFLNSNTGGGGAPQGNSRPAQQSQQRSAPPQGASAAPADDYQEDDDIPF
jgi:single-strand DNA-binding protein